MKKRNMSDSQLVQIEGKNPLAETLKTNRRAYKIYYTPGLQKDERVNEILTEARKRQIPLFETNRTNLDKIAKTDIHQGIIGFFEPLSNMRLNEFLESLEHNNEKKFLALFTAVDYEQNLGSILRTAEAAGVSGIILPPHEKGVTPVVERVAMGAANFVPVISESLFPALKMLREYGYKLIGVETVGEKLYYHEDLKGPVVFVIGGENRGVTEPVRERCDTIIKIPLHGQIGSLNIGVAFGIIAYEKVRQEKA